MFMFVKSTYNKGNLINKFQQRADVSIFLVSELGKRNSHVLLHILFLFSKQREGKFSFRVWW